MLKEELESLNLKPVRPTVYPGTYAIIKAASMMAEDVTNRSSASWKKAEHIFFDSIFPDGGKSLIPYWNSFAKSNPDGVKSTQALYVPIRKGEYIKYDVQGNPVARGTLNNFFFK